MSERSSQLQDADVQDRMAKAMEVLSNIMKKMSDTQSSIIQNMK